MEYQHRSCDDDVARWRRVPRCTALADVDFNDDMRAVNLMRIARKRAAFDGGAEENYLRYIGDIPSLEFEGGSKNHFARFLLSQKQIFCMKPQTTESTQTSTHLASACPP